MKKSLLVFLSLTTCILQASETLDIEPEHLSARDSGGVFGSAHQGAGVFDSRTMGTGGNRGYYEGNDRDYYNNNYYNDNDRNYRRNQNWNRINERRLRDRYYQYNNYYDNGYYVPMNNADSYNDITNPYPGTGSQNSNFNNSNFDSQIWDFNN